MKLDNGVDLREALTKLGASLIQMASSQNPQQALFDFSQKQEAVEALAKLGFFNTHHGSIAEEVLYLHSRFTQFNREIRITPPSQWERGLQLYVQKMDAVLSPQSSPLPKYPGIVYRGINGRTLDDSV